PSSISSTQPISQPKSSLWIFHRRKALLLTRRISRKSAPFPLTHRSGEFTWIACGVIAVRRSCSRVRWKPAGRPNDEPAESFCERRPAGVGTRFVARTSGLYPRGDNGCADGNDALGGGISVHEHPGLDHLSIQREYADGKRQCPDRVWQNDRRDSQRAKRACGKSDR